MKPYVAAVTQLISLPIDVPKHFASQLRRADDFIKLGVVAAEKVLDNHEPDQKTGLFVGTAFGPMQTNFDVLGLIVDEDQTSPTLFSHSVFNSAAGYIARLFNIPGRCFTFTDFSWPFFQALMQGYNAIVADQLDHCLILQIESYSDLLADARKRTLNNSVAWQPGALAWYLSKHDNGTGWVLDHIDIENVPVLPGDHLHRNEELYCGQESKICTTPLDATASVTDLILETPCDRDLNCQLSAPYGTVSLTFLPHTV